LKVGFRMWHKLINTTGCV